MYLRDEKQNKPGSVEDTEYRLGMFFAEVDVEGKVVRGLDEATLSSIRRSKAWNSMRGFVAERPSAVGRSPSTPTGTSSRRRSRFCGGARWKKKWIARNPLDEVEGVGKRSTGKSSSASTRRGGGRRKAVELRGLRARRARWRR